MQHLALQAAEVGVWDWDIVSGRIRVNDAAWQMLGFGEHDSCTDMQSWVERVHPQDLPRMRAALRAALEDADNPVYTRELRLRHRMGHWLWVLDRGRVVERDTQGRATRFVGTHLDITVLMDAQQRLRTSEQHLLESTHRLQDAQRVAHIGSWELDLRSGRLEWSDEIYRIFGMDPGRFDASYEAFLEAVHPQDREAVNAAYQHSLQTRQPYDITHRLLLADACVKYVHEQCETEFSPDGTPLRSLGTVQDITEQHLLQQALSALATTLAPLQGRAFYEAVAQHLVGALCCSNYAFIARLEPGRTHARVLAGWSAGGSLESFVYALEGTPCENVAQHGYEIYAQGVQQLFPQDTLLVQMGVESYLGCALLDKHREPMGLLVVLGCRPLAQGQRARRLLELFVDRVGAEMLRETAQATAAMYATVFERSGEAIVITDQNNDIVQVNEAFTRMTGYALDEVRGRNPRLLASGRTPRDTYQTLWAALTTSGYWQGELWDRRKDGSVYPKWASITMIRDDQGRPTHHVASFSDISERKAADAYIERLAHHDALTGLLNRYSLESRLAQALLSARRDERALAVMFIDLDRFKTINDTLGHAAGDCLLQEVAQRLKSTVRESDIVARQGGDEFVVALTQVDAAASVVAVAEKLLQVLSQPYHWSGQALHTSPSIGVAMYPQDGDSVVVLLRDADAAMYAAKEAGRARVCFFTATIMAQAQERRELEQDLRTAMATDQLELHYQPQVLARSGRIVGVEALLRWRHPAKGWVPPARFIGVAEDCGLMWSLGQWVMEQACAQLRGWRAQGLSELRVAVNVSAHQLRAQDFVQLVLQTLQDHGLPGAALELEITESVAMADPDIAIGLLQQLRNAGVGVAIDDFGTGYSSLAYLKRLPIQTLKLDRSFVQDIENDGNDAAICAATLALAHRLGLRVVAEGVETCAQRDFLVADHGCDVLQGYLFGRPMPAPEMTQRLLLHTGTPN